GAPDAALPTFAGGRDETVAVDGGAGAQVRHRRQGIRKALGGGPRGASLLGSAPPMSSDAPNPFQPPADAAPRAAATPLWRRVLPFVVAIGLVAFTLRHIDMHAFVEQLAAVNAPAYMLFATAFVLALLTADAFATAKLYSLTVAPVGFRELWTLRGASYLPSIVSHHLGQAFLTYSVSRRHGVSLARMAGGTLLSYASWAGLLLAVFAIAMFVSGSPIWEPLAVLGGGVLYLAVIAWRPAPLA